VGRLVSEGLLFNVIWAIFQLGHGENRLYSMRWRWCPLCTRPNTHSWICIVLTHWNNTPCVDNVAPLPHIIPIPGRPVFTVMPWCCMLSREAANTNFIVFGLIRPVLKPAIYNTRVYDTSYSRFAITRVIVLESSYLFLTEGMYTSGYITVNVTKRLKNWKNYVFLFK
jgi:hypothetical protein